MNRSRTPAGMVTLVFLVACSSGGARAPRVKQHPRCPRRLSTVPSKLPFKPPSLTGPTARARGPCRISLLSA